MWLNWSDWTSHLSDNPISADVLSVPGSGSPFSALRSTFPVPCLPLCHCCLIMLLVNFHTQLRLTTSKAVSKLERKTCEVAEHNNRCEEGKIIIFLRRVEVLSCLIHRYFVFAIEWINKIKQNKTDKQKNNSLIIQTTSKVNQNYHG